MERPQNLKKSPTCFDKTAVFTQNVKTSGRFFQIFVTFSEKLDFNLPKKVACCSTDNISDKVNLRQIL